MLSRNDIRQALAKGSIKILPFDERNLTGIGYNLSTTKFAFSTTRGVLLEIKHEVDASGDVSYVEIPPNDVVLLYSREYIEVDNSIAGTLHSKVSCVCQGLGHISTTLDPTWRGQLIISMGNPTSRSVKFVLSKSGGNVLTLLFHRLDTPVTGPNIHDNNMGRCDLLLSHFASRGEGAVDQKKYLELERFVVGPFASSLNGDDSFLGDWVAPDAYSKKARQLESLRDRLKEDSLRFRNRRHLGDLQSLYKVSGSIEDDGLIRSCALFKADPDDDLFHPVTLYGGDGEELALDVIARCMRIVEYELETIEHSRRVKWQDAEIAKFADAESELSKLKRRLDRREFWRKARPNIILIALVVLAIVLFTVWLGPMDSGDAVQYAAAVFALASVVATLAIGVFDKRGD